MPRYSDTANILYSKHKYAEKNAKFTKTARFYTCSGSRYCPIGLTIPICLSRLNAVHGKTSGGNTLYTMRLSVTGCLKESS